MTGLGGKLQFETEEAGRHPGRHEVLDALLYGDGDPVPAVVKKTRTTWRQRLSETKAERSLRVARHLLSKGIPTPEPLGIEVREDESWYVARRIEGAVQIRVWFRHRYETGQPAPTLPFTFEEVVLGLGRLARSLHDAGIFFRDFTDGNVLISGEGEALHFWLVDLNRARLGRQPLGSLARLRDLSRPGLNREEDRRILLESYFAPRPARSSWSLGLTLLRARVRAWDHIKKVLRPWKDAVSFPL